MRAIGVWEGLLVDLRWPGLPYEQRADTRATVHPVDVALPLTCRGYLSPALAGWDHSALELPRILKREAA